MSLLPSPTPTPPTFLCSNAIYTLFTFTNVFLLLPLYILILYMGFQRWRHQHSVPSGQINSHSDFFTYHMVTVEIFGVFGSLLYSLSIYTKSATISQLGLFVSCITYPGQTLFHCLTCVERYLAVVHPITYMHLRETGGVRIRNISIVCVWLLCFLWVGLTHFYWPDFTTMPLICLLVASIIVIFFCCLSVICVLTHPGPGEVGRDKERVDQSKQRAFHTIVALAGVLLLRFAGLLVCLIFANVLLIHHNLCALMDFAICLTPPSSLVLPLLFLKRKSLKLKHKVTHFSAPPPRDNRLKAEGA